MVDTDNGIGSLADVGEVAMSYIAANGQEITDEMVERWCAAYESGGFPEGERTVGGVVMGRPPLSSDKTVTSAIGAARRPVCMDGFDAVLAAAPWGGDDPRLSRFVDALSRAGLALSVTATEER